MAFNLQSFVSEPRTEEFNSLKKAELLQVAQHFKLTVNTSMGKGEIKKIVLNHLVEEELLPEEELENVNTREDHLELKKFEFQEREREVQLRLRELEIREKELAVEYKTKEIELHNAKSMGGPATNVGVTFDVGKHIRFVPPFQETEVDKYFMHFEKIAASLKWPEDVWTVLLQSVLIGKAREIYSALPVDQSSNYLLVKEAVLKAYELVPEAYRQKFRKTTKEENQTYVEFARMKERLFDRWCTSQNVNGEYAKLRQLLLLEEFKNCLPSEVKTYLDEHKVESLQRGATLADDYTLTHKRVFPTKVTEVEEQTGRRQNQNRNGNTSSVSSHYNLRSVGHGELSSDQTRKGNRLPSVPICHYCKRKGHIMSECWTLRDKNKKTACVVKKVNPKHNGVLSTVGRANDFKPFISQGLISLIGDEDKAKPVSILRDTGASQSLMLKDVLLLSEQSYTGSNVLIQGVKSEVISIPLHIVSLHTELVSGPVMVGAMTSLPVEGISLILGNDLAGNRVMTDPCMCSTPRLSTESEESELQRSGVFPSCAVTRAMAKKNADSAGDTMTELVGQMDNSLTDLSTLSHSNEPHSTKVPGEQGALTSPRLTRDQLIKDQQADQDLSIIAQRAGSEQEARDYPVCYFMKNGVLMRKWRPPHVPSTQEWEITYQIVVPKNCREEVIKLAHSTPLAGHLGISKTYNRILSHFYWPGLRKDVVQFCRSCHTCQLVGKPSCCSTPTNTSI